MSSSRKSRKNIYIHEIDLADLKIRNTPREKFRKTLEKIKYRGYEVEKLKDGREIVITKPGGKFTFGTIKREDFMVWVYDPVERTLWLISHKNIWEDLEEKGRVNPIKTTEVINCLEKVFKGEEPDDVLKDKDWSNLIGESPELLLKAYKWIWGQEDSNYPEGKGRAMSWEGWQKNKQGEWVKTGTGIADLRRRLEQKLSDK